MSWSWDLSKKDCWGVMWQFAILIDKGCLNWYGVASGHHVALHMEVTSIGCNCVDNLINLMVYLAVSPHSPLHISIQPFG